MGRFKGGSIMRSTWNEEFIITGLHMSVCLILIPQYAKQRAAEKLWKYSKCKREKGGDKYQSFRPPLYTIIREKVSTLTAIIPSFPREMGIWTCTHIQGNPLINIELANNIILSVTFVSHLMTSTKMAAITGLLYYPK